MMMGVASLHTHTIHTKGFLLHSNALLPHRNHQFLIGLRQSHHVHVVRAGAERSTWLPGLDPPLHLDGKSVPDQTSN